jgi:hypothetical protein
MPLFGYEKENVPQDAIDLVDQYDTDSEEEHDENVLPDNKED